MQSTKVSENKNLCSRTGWRLYALTDKTIFSKTFNTFEKNSIIF